MFFFYYYKNKKKSKRRWGMVPRWASDVTVLRLNTGITVIAVYRSKPSVRIYFTNEKLTEIYQVKSK